MYALWIRETCGKSKLVSKDIVDFQDLIAKLNKADLDFPNVEEIYVKYYERSLELENPKVPI